MNGIPADSTEKDSTNGAVQAKKKIKKKFPIGQDVLARWNDGLFYLGKVLKVNESSEKCYIKFEDNSEYWALFKDVQKGPNQGEISCCLCLGEVSEQPNEIVLCDHCGLGYHQECHNPVIEHEVLQPDVPWLCRPCVFATTVKKGGAMKKGPNAQAFEVMRQSLPYDLKKLSWDNHHKINSEQCYCYCGGPGDWYMKMLQCCRCRQWFHEACIQCLEKPLLYGDRFYIFVCSFCNSGPEYIKRLDLNWTDIGQLALFNLTIQHNKKYFELVDQVMPWVHKNWDRLQLQKLELCPRLERESHLVESFQNHKGRFQCGKEIRKKTTLWGLRVRVPPPSPIIILPVDGQITDEVMSNLQMKGKKTKTFVPNHSTSPVPLRYHKRRASMEAEEINKKAKRRKLMLDEPVGNFSKNGGANQDYVGYAGDAKKYQVTRPPENASLDTFIPWPSSYEGLNHPFKTVLERNREIEHQKIKERLLNSYHSGFIHSDIESDTMTETDSEVTSVSHSGSVDFEPEVRKKRGRKKRSDVQAQIAGKKLSNSKNVVRTDTVNRVSQREVPLDHLRCSVSNYFGAADRLAKGEHFHVLARRVSPEGKVQYLVQWEGMIA